MILFLFEIVLLFFIDEFVGLGFMLNQLVQFGAWLAFFGFWLKLVHTILLRRPKGRRLFGNRLQGDIFRLFSGDHLRTLFGNQLNSHRLLGFLDHGSLRQVKRLLLHMFGCFFNGIQVNRHVFKRVASFMHDFPV